MINDINDIINDEIEDKDNNIERKCKKHDIKITYE